MTNERSETRTVEGKRCLAVVQESFERVRQEWTEAMRQRSGDRDARRSLERKAWRANKIAEIERARRDLEQQQAWVKEVEERVRKKKRERCWGWWKWGWGLWSLRASPKRTGRGVLEPLLTTVENPVFAHEHQD